MSLAQDHTAPQAEERTPYPYTVSVIFNRFAEASLLFDFGDPRRPKQACIAAAALFAARVPHALIEEPERRPAWVRVRLPLGVSRVYTAQDGNVGLEFTGVRAARRFLDSIDGVGSASFVNERHLFRVYLGVKKL